MPLMMDDDQYMEDLFNDSAEQIPISVGAPPVKRLAQRLDELQENGCCQKIAWSKSGCVANITRDGRGISLRAFQRDSSTGKWVLGDASPLEILSSHDEYPLVHVSWGHLGVDLTVIDAAGRVLIFTATQAVDRLKLTRDNVADQESEYNAVVGLHWLPVAPQQTRYHVLWSVERTEEKWRNHITSHEWKEPHNPLHLSLAGFLCFTRGGTVRLFFQQPDRQWADTSTDIEPATSAKDIFTHASFASDTATSILLAAHTVTGSILVYRVKVNWNAQAGKPGSPVLDTTPLKTELNCSAQVTDLGTGDATLGASAKVSYPAKLTHLEFVPNGPDDGSMEPSHPTILAVFAHTPPPLPSIMDQTQSQQHPFSIISRWELHESKHSLLSGFESIKKRPVNSAERRHEVTLKRLPDIVMGTATIGLFCLNFYTRFAFCQSNGFVEFRDRYSMEVMSADLNQNRVTSLIQSGFSFTTIDSGLHVALSPNACILATIQPDGQITCKNMEFTSGSLNDGSNSPETTAAIAALVLQYSSASLSLMTVDDLFAIMPQNMESRLKYLFLSGTYHCLNASAEWCREDNGEGAVKEVMRQNVIRACLSTQSLLGLRSDGTRSLSGKLAWTILSLRFTGTLISLPVYQVRSTRPESFTHETAAHLRGLVKWNTDLVVYIFEELIELLNSCRGHENDRGFVQRRINDMCSPGLLLLLCSFPRFILRLMRPVFQGLLNICHSQMRNAPTVAARTEFHAVFSTILSSPVPTPQINAIIDEVDKAVRHAYEKAQFNDERRKATEREMLIWAEIPDVLMPVVTHLFRFTTKILETVDASKVMYYDLRWLGLGEDRRTKQWNQRNTVDVLRKVVLTEKDVKRKCVKCGSLSKDTEWRWGIHNKCSCGSPWVMGGAKS
ncbi:mediator complex, subunit Med16 [Phyllosticta citrichinensis]|uniref:Mediator of RNA polymerase II transcription subunit 16 n=1 Tax=Phyllosticta citrichinensis TaxID=1130410 RepID=A0ABR1XUA3_9PEZI